MTDRNSILIIVFAALAVSLPFCGRAFFVDDCYHVAMAKGLIDHPLRPYDFRSDDNAENVKSWEPGGFPRMVNPPLLHYYLAFVIKLFGEEEWKLRLFYLVFPVSAALAAFYLGKRFTEHPLTAVIIFIFTPAFWLSSYSLLIDMCMLAFVLWGYELFMRGWESDNWGYMLGSGVLLGLAPMAKYTAYSAVGILLLWPMFNLRGQKHKIKYLSALLIPAVIFFVWYFWNISVYGESHFFAAWKRANIGALMPKLIVGLTFLSGVSIFSVIYSNFIFQRLKRMFRFTFLIFLLLVFSFLVFIFSSPRGGFEMWQSGMLSVFLVNSVLIFVVLTVNSKRLDPFLFLWFIGGFMLLMLSIPWVAGRYYLFIMFPLIMLTMRLMKIYFPKPIDSSKVLITVVILTGFVSLAAAVGDYKQAEVYRNIAGDIEQDDAVRKAEGKKIVMGDAFFGYSYYLKKRGWRVIFDQDSVDKGDLILGSLYSLPRAARPKWDFKKTIVKIVEYPSVYPVRVMDVPSSAGFYASAGGALPFSFSKRPLEVFLLYRAELLTAKREF